MTIEMIPLNKLVPSAANVRKTGALIGIEELAASIDAHGLLQNLQVRQSRKDSFEVVAGGRRLAALKLLVKQKRLAKDFPVPCHVLDAEDCREISLAENIMRLSMHPADQFEAFFALIEAGKGVEEIAARFGVSVAVVRQRLKLAGVSPRLIEIYRAEEMSLDQLMAFTVSDDHAAQEAAWFETPDYDHSPADIRASLTAAQVSPDDKRVRLIGIDVYRQAGGGLNRDLFQPEHAGYLTDPALLDRLVAQRLEAEAASVRAEGWQWVEIMPRRDYAAMHAFGRVYPERLPLPDAPQQELDQLSAEYDALAEGDGGGDLPPEIIEQLDALSDRIDTLTESASQYRAEDLALAGAVISIGYDGTLDIERGLIRPEDQKALAALSASDETSGVLAEPDPSAPLSLRLIESLTAERTAALRAMMQENEAVALASLCHALALPIFYPYDHSAVSCLDLKLVSRNLTDCGVNEQSHAALLLDNREAGWQKRLPEHSADLFGWLLAQDMPTLINLISFCAALGIDAVRGKSDRPNTPRLRHADELAAALNLDMRLWWSPTRDSYLGRVSKALVLEAVSEAVSCQAAENLAGLKKDALIARAEQKLSGQGWLPPMLRSPKADAQETAPRIIAEAELEPIATE